MEYIPILSNAVVIVLILYSVRQSSNQEKTLNAHIISFTREIMSRPDFNQLEDRIEKATKSVCKKREELESSFKQHKHEKVNGAVVIGV